MSLILLFPLSKIDFDINLESYLKEQDFLNRKKIFNKFEKAILIKERAIKARKRKFKIIFNKDFPDKVFISLYLYRIEIEYLEEKSYIYFILLNIFSKFFVDFSKLIQILYEKKLSIIELFDLFIEEFNEFKKRNLIQNIISESGGSIPFISYNIFFHKLQNDLRDFIKIYKTGRILFEDYELAILSNYRDTLWINKIKTRHSSKKIKILMIRTFLIRLFSWYISLPINIREKNHPVIVKLAEYISFIKNNSRCNYIYSEIIKNNKFLANLSNVLIIFDTLNQTYFLNHNCYEYRIKQIERLISLNSAFSRFLFKYAFITSDILRNNSQALNYLEKNGWNFLYINKAKKTDYDSKISTYFEELNILFPNTWQEVYVISADNDIIQYFLKIKAMERVKNLYFITEPNNRNLDSNNSLTRKVLDEYDLNLYYSL
ncbi:MAG: hypothetical protein ACP6IY_22515 [Promethearchaeia archaeon]